MNDPHSRQATQPQLHDIGLTRSLSFDSGLIQSCMKLDAPEELLLEYTRAMMGVLLFNQQPRSILMIGLGGGSLPKYCHKHLPETRVKVIEIEQSVIDMRHEFAVPPDDERLQVICDDGARFMTQVDQRYDVIMVDGFTAQGQPMVLCTPSFYKHCAEALTPQGMLVVNMHKEQPALSLQVRRLSKVFRGCAIDVSVDDGDNQVVFAGQADAFAACLTEFTTRWDALPPIHQFTLGACSSRIERALRKGYIST